MRHSLTRLAPLVMTSTARPLVAVLNTAGWRSARVAAHRARGLRRGPRWPFRHLVGPRAPRSPGLSALRTTVPDWWKIPCRYTMRPHPSCHVLSARSAALSRGWTVSAIPTPRYRHPRPGPGAAASRRSIVSTIEVTEPVRAGHGVLVHA